MIFDVAFDVVWVLAAGSEKGFEKLTNGVRKVIDEVAKEIEVLLKNDEYDYVGEEI